jgi:hypothetical protein
MHLAFTASQSGITTQVPLNRTVVESTIAAALGGPLFGFDTAVIAGITNMMVLQFIVVLRFFPETKGFTLEELQQRLETK